MSKVIYAKTITIFELNDDELSKLREAVRENEMDNEFAKAVEVEVEHRRKQREIWRGEFDEYKHPTDDEVGIVRCVHEGVCPTCGRRVDFDSAAYETYPADWVSDEHQYDWEGHKITCPADHISIAEPTELGSDWTGWIEQSEPATWIYTE